MVRLCASVMLLLSGAVYSTMLQHASIEVHQLNKVQSATFIPTPTPTPKHVPPTATIMPTITAYPRYASCTSTYHQSDNVLVITMTCQLP